MTSLGHRLGYRHSIFVITLAGTALALLASSITLIAGLALHNNHPHASLYLTTIGIYSFLEHAQYALSALWISPAELGHDFVRLMTLGLHPTVATVAIISIPIIITVGYLSLKNLHDSSIRRNCSSDNIWMFSFWAFSYLDPGSLPTTT